MKKVKIPIIGKVIEDKKLGNKVVYYKKTNKQASIYGTETPPEVTD